MQIICSNHQPLKYLKLQLLGVGSIGKAYLVEKVSDHS